MSAYLITQASHARFCMQRLQSLGCRVLSFGGSDNGITTVAIAAPTAALLDHLDAQQLRTEHGAEMAFATLDECVVLWPAARDVRVDEGEHIELAP